MSSQPLPLTWSSQKERRRAGKSVAEFALAVWWTREYDAVCGAFAD